MNDKLLIVDDESDVLDFASNFFKKRKIDVITASSGEDALKEIANEEPRIVLLDIKMKGISGIETLRMIKAINSQIKVIMVTGSNDEEAWQKTKDLGADGFIHKPLRLDELENAVLDIWKRSG